MADRKIMIDTSILIDFYRKTDKANSAWYKLVKEGYTFSIASITKYEIYAGASSDQLAFWDKVLETIDVHPFDDVAAGVAATINMSLKAKRKQIDIADLFIAATVLTNNMQFATLNRKHFDRIEDLKLLNV